MLESVMAVSAVALLLFMFALWVLSLFMRDASIFDPGWGLGFLLVVWTAFVEGEGTIERRALVAILVSVWGLRLTIHLLVRKLKNRREDPRYAVIRARHGARFPLVSFGVVFLFQSALLWIVSLPPQYAASATGELGPLHAVGTAVWALGLFFEAVGDEQLRRFKAGSSGWVMDGGLWRYTRHPNYFGDFLVWWGMYLIALSPSPIRSWWTVVGPLVMSLLLLRISGKTLLERQLITRPGYADYVSRTSGFVPLPPRRGSSR